MSRRRVLLTQGRLPSGYQEVEWIEPSGNAYIKTSVFPIHHDGVELKYSRGASLSTDLIHFSAGTGNYQLVTAQSYWRTYSDKATSWSVNGTSPKTTYKTTVRITFPTTSKSLIEVYHDDVYYNFAESPAYAQNPDTVLYIFARANLQQFDNGTRLYYFKLADKIHLIPCYRKSDGVIGMYDLCGSICPLTSTPFYINAGAGEFTAGPAV